MAVRNGGNGSSGGKDAAYLASGSTTKVHNDLYEGRMTDADLEYCDGHPLEEREEWNMAKVMRRGKWPADE